MDREELKEKFLHYLYSKNFGEGDPTLDALDNWAKSKSFDRRIFWEEYDHLVKQDYIHYRQDEGTVRLTAIGALHTEKAGYAPVHLVAKYRAMRKKLIKALAEHLTTCDSIMTLDVLADKAGLEGEYYLGNLELLISLGYARWIIPLVRLNICSKVCAKAASLATA